MDISIEITRYITDILGIEAKFLIASSLPNLSEEPTERLVDICKALSIDTYLSGRDGAKYMDMEKFEREKIKVIFQDFHQV